MDMTFEEIVRRRALVLWRKLATEPLNVLDDGSDWFGDRERTPSEAAARDRFADQDARAIGTSKP